MSDIQTESRKIQAISGQFRKRLRETVTVSRGIFRRKRPLGVFLGVTGIYLITFLWMLNDIIFTSSAGFSLFVVDSVISTMVQPAPGAFLFQPIALLELWILAWEFSPINTVIGLGIASLVGLNLAVSYLAITQPSECGLSPSAGVFASVPALLAGSACCAPVIFLVLGIQMSGVLLTAFFWLLPVSVTLLVITLMYMASKVDPTAV